ncbi:MAG: glycerate kinase [Schwartzia sp.]|nr:glycerate kinase [Schwartzia sp. (in: firmicutes)]
MKKVIVIPDSFKGSLSASEVAAIMAAAVRERFPAAMVDTLPIADGGEGTVAAFLAAAGGEHVPVTVTGPLFEPVPAFYGRLPDGTAVIELASAAGLPLVHGKPAVGEATTFGVGELMGAALADGAKRLLLGLGGSATNDGGCGAAASLGAVFRDGAGKAFVPTGATLSHIAAIDMTGLRETLADVSVTVLGDVDTPLCGPRGAAAVFGPQKGADAAMVRRLDEGLAHLAAVIEQTLGKRVADLPGAGAAGGMGAGAVAFFGGRLVRGIDALLEAARFDERLAGTDVVFTGEGRFDSQSLMGKAVGGIARRASAAGVPVVCVAGAVDIAPAEARAAGVSAAFSIQPGPLPLDTALAQSRENLANTMRHILGLWAIAHSPE